MTCVINLPKHFSNWQVIVFQPRYLLFDLMTNRGSPVKSGNKYVSGTELRKRNVETLIYVYIKKSETGLIFCSNRKQNGNQLR